MKNRLYAVSLQIILALILFIPNRSQAMEMQLQAGATFDWWGDDSARNESASQLTFPLLITGTMNNLNFRLTTAFTRTSLSTDAVAGDVSMSGLLDTKIGATYRFSDRLPFELLLGLDLNLPTGKTNLSAAETRLVMDPDLLPVNSYGEGFNVNPTVTVAKGWNNWILALGIGYLWRGSYDFSATLKDYEPGMVFNTLAEARYYFTKKSSARLFAGYTIYDTDTSEGKDTFREGNVLLIGGAFSHPLTPSLRLSAGLKGIFRGDATVYDKGAGTEQNLNAFNGTETIFDLGGSYALDSKTVLSIPFQVRMIASNGNSSPYSSGAKEKYSLGVGAERKITPMLSADLSLKGFYKHDDATEIPERTEARSFTGIGIAAALTGRF